MIIGGDLAPTKSNISYFNEGNLSGILDENLLSLLNSVNYRIFNLEAPLTDIETPINKTGPNLIAPTSTIKGIKFLNPSILSLANNHILDQGGQGLINTMELLTSHDIKYVGAGKDISTASKPVFIEMEGIKTGFYTCAENEFSIASENKPGANPFDPLYSLDHIAAAKSKCDFLIVLHHGGKEHYRFPSPNLQKICRRMVDKGADLVICQHSHCIGAYELYSDRTIVYGQGNFLFDRSNNKFWLTSLLIKATIKDKISIEYIPVCKKGNGVELPTTEIKEVILKDFFTRSASISMPGFIESEYAKFCSTNGPYYLRNIAGFGNIIQKIDTVLKNKISKTLYSQTKLTRLQNFIECEAHRELLLKYLEVLKKS